jgi:nucleotide-binding universal stress UspA family protein
VAIKAAADESAKLIFLYISDVHFLDHTAGPIALDVIETQLEEVGEFILAIAKERAAKSGLEAQGIVLRGDFRTALEDAIKNFGVDLIIFGSAVSGTGAMTPDYNKRLFEHLTDEYGVEIFVTREGVVVDRLAPDQSQGPDLAENDRPY